MKYAELLGASQVRKNVYTWGESLKVVIEIALPSHLPKNNISLAFSIKDLKGTDLIVSTTHDFTKLDFSTGESFRVSFDFINHLTAGKYLLVVAVEDRENKDIHYYEYIEGVQYFASESDRRLFGVFQPSVTQSSIQLAP